MLLSERHSFVFIHVPKTAGTSVTAALKAVDPTAVTRLAGLRSTKHVTAVQIREAYPEFSRLFSFAILRDPYERFCSLYRYIKTLPTYAEHMRPITTLEAFAELFQQPSWVDQLHSSRPQRDYVTDDTGQVIVTSLFRFESLATAAAEISARIGSNLKLPHKRTTMRESPDRRLPIVERMVVDRFGCDYELLARLPLRIGEAPRCSRESLFNRVRTLSRAFVRW
jgi:hypothetical protein